MLLHLMIAEGLNMCCSFAPLDFHNPQKPERWYGLQSLYKHYRIPTEFVIERMQTVTHSFGSYMHHDQSYGESMPLD